LMGFSRAAPIWFAMCRVYQIPGHKSRPLRLPGSIARQLIHNAITALTFLIHTHSVEAHWLVADMIYTYRVTTLLGTSPKALVSLISTCAMAQRCSGRCFFEVIVQQCQAVCSRLCCSRRRRETTFLLFPLPVSSNRRHLVPGKSGTMFIPFSPITWVHSTRKATSLQKTKGRQATQQRLSCSPSVTAPALLC